jgi:hypothetical protein
MWGDVICFLSGIVILFCATRRYLDTITAVTLVLYGIISLTVGSFGFLFAIAGTP